MQEAGELMKRARKAQRLTQNQVSTLSGVGLNTIHKIERGQSDVSLRNLLAVATALGVTVRLQSPLGEETMLDA